MAGVDSITSRQSVDSRQSIESSQYHMKMMIILIWWWWWWWWSRSWLWWWWWWPRWQWCLLWSWWFRVWILPILLKVDIPCSSAESFDLKNERRKTSHTITLNRDFIIPLVYIEFYSTINNQQSNPKSKAHQSDEPLNIESCTEHWKYVALKRNLSRMLFLW